jgi:hypothetical protein
MDPGDVAEAPTLLDALARAPAAAALVVGALGEADRKALRLAHLQLRDAVSEEATELCANLRSVDRLAAFLARPPTARRWPRLKELTIWGPDWAALEALGTETWEGLRTLRLSRRGARLALDAPATRALAAALRRMPALRALVLERVTLPDAAAEALFRAMRADAVPQLRTLSIRFAGFTPATARALAATGWRLEELDLRRNYDLVAAGLAALLVTPTFALRRLNLRSCSLDTAVLLAVANAPWPLEELDLSFNVFNATAAAPALGALSRHARLRGLDVSHCDLSAAGFKALVEARWPALTFLDADGAKMAFDGPHALGDAAFAGFPALETLDLSNVKLGEAGARLLASRRWARLKSLAAYKCGLGDAGLAALARGDFPGADVARLARQRPQLLRPAGGRAPLGAGAHAHKRLSGLGDNYRGNYICL